MRQVLLTHCYPTDDDPCAGSFVKNWMLQHKTKFEVMHFPYGGRLSALNVFKLLWYLYRVAKAVKSIDRQLTVYVHWWIPIGWLAVRTGARVEVICHGSDIWFLSKHRMIAKMFTRYAKRVKHWLFVSEYLRSEFLKLYPMIPMALTSIEPMPINTKIFTNKRFPKLENSFVTCGELTKQKNIEAVLRYVSQFSAQVHCLYVIGDGRQRKYLEEMACVLGINAMFTGRVSQERVASIFNNCEKFLLFSKHEGYGLVIDEAKLCGCQTIVNTGDGKAEHADILLERIP